MYGSCSRANMKNAVDMKIKNQMETGVAQDHIGMTMTSIQHLYLFTRI